MKGLFSGTIAIEGPSGDFLRNTTRRSSNYREQYGGHLGKQAC